jgi:hypothetical protein
LHDFCFSNCFLGYRIVGTTLASPLESHPRACPSFPCIPHRRPSPSAWLPFPVVDIPVASLQPMSTTPSLLPLCLCAVFLWVVCQPRLVIAIKPLLKVEPKKLVSITQLSPCFECYSSGRSIRTTRVHHCSCNAQLCKDLGASESDDEAHVKGVPQLFVRSFTTFHRSDVGKYRNPLLPLQNRVALQFIKVVGCMCVGLGTTMQVMTLRTQLNMNLVQCKHKQVQPSTPSKQPQKRCVLCNAHRSSAHFLTSAVLLPRCRLPGSVALHLHKPVEDFVLGTHNRGDVHLRPVLEQMDLSVSVAQLWCSMLLPNPSTQRNHTAFQQFTRSNTKAKNMAL